LAHILADETTSWESVTVEDWYGEGKRDVEVTSDTAVWYHTGKPVVPIRWVIIRDPEGDFEPQALLSTALHLSPQDIVGSFVRRGQMEVTFEEARAHLGLETQRQWNSRAIARTTPAVLALYSLITVMARALLSTESMPVRRGIERSRQPFPTRSRWCGGGCGSRHVFLCRMKGRTWKKSRAPWWSA
jgi:hypothetical protein